MVGLDGEKLYVGEEALAKKGVLNLSYPLEHGVVNDWD
jgi:actin, other eukaryote